MMAMVSNASARVRIRGHGVPAALCMVSTVQEKGVHGQHSA